jgi:hypothetical protein
MSIDSNEKTTIIMVDFGLDKESIVFKPPLSPPKIMDELPMPNDANGKPLERVLGSFLQYGNKEIAFEVGKVPGSSMIEYIHELSKYLGGCAVHIKTSGDYKETS